MSNRHKSEEPFFSLGEKFIELGAALQDKRTTLNEVSDLALNVGLIFQFSFADKHETRTEGVNQMNGSVVVPVEPTKEMQEQFWYAYEDCDRHNFRVAYKAMISAAPTPEPVAPERITRTRSDGSRYVDLADVVEKQKADGRWEQNKQVQLSAPEQSEGKNFWNDISDEADAEADRISRELHSEITPMVKQSEAERLAIAAYQAGYGRGHNDTVEGCYNGACEDDNEAALEWLSEQEKSE